MGELAQVREVRQIVPPKFDKETYRHACVIAGEDVLALRMEEQGTQHFVPGYVEHPANNWDRF